MTNGMKLRAWRERSGLSQARAAAKVGAKQKTWCQWEADATTPEIDFAEAIERLTSGSVAMRDWVRARRKKRQEDSSSVDVSAHARKAG
jgi:DNA-binding XRE family transcriptional regulator